MGQKLKYSELEAENAVYQKIIAEQSVVISEQADTIDFMGKKIASCIELVSPSKNNREGL